MTCDWQNRVFRFQVCSMLVSQKFIKEKLQGQRWPEIWSTSYVTKISVRWTQFHLTNEIHYLQQKYNICWLQSILCVSAFQFAAPLPFQSRRFAGDFAKRCEGNKEGRGREREGGSISSRRREKIDKWDRIIRQTLRCKKLSKHRTGWPITFVKTDGWHWFESCVLV